MNRRPNIAIDGPAGAGKSTAARLLAERLGYLYIDTGAMYRAVTLQALSDRIDMTDEQALVETALNVSLSFIKEQSGGTRLLLNGLDVTEQIRTPPVTEYVSLVSRVPGVRKTMSRLQREMAARGGVVMEGRDIGTHVLPDAEAKFFLTASVEERARRRYEELKRRGYPIEFDVVKSDISKRDAIDSNREVAPLKPAPDAEVIDCSQMTVDRVVELILAGVSGRLN